MKVVNCKLIHSAKIGGREMTYIQAHDPESKSHISLEIVSHKNQAFVKVDSKYESKLIPMSNISDIRIEIEQAEDGKGSDQGSVRSSSAQKAGGLSASVSV